MNSNKHNYCKSKIVRKRRGIIYNKSNPIDCTTHHLDLNMALRRAKKSRRVYGSTHPAVRAQMPIHRYVYKCRKCGYKVISRTQKYNLCCPLDGTRMKQFFA